MIIEPNPEIRKAAILIDSLDSKSAKLLMEQLNRETAEIVKRQLQQLDDVSRIEKETVLAEFLKTVQIVAKDNPVPIQ